MKQKDAPPVDRSRIIQSALALIDAEGLDRFSLSRVAGRIGIASASLYYYFADKADLLAAVARHLLDDAVRHMPAKRGGWEDVLIATSLEARRSILRHPNAAPLLLLYPPRHLAVEGYERGLKLLEAKGVATSEALQICLGLENITWGSTLLAAAALSRGLPAFPSFDPAQLHALAGATRANRKTDEQLFVQTCRAFLAGFASLRDGTTPFGKGQTSTGS